MQKLFTCLGWPDATNSGDCLLGGGFACSGSSKDTAVPPIKADPGVKDEEESLDDKLKKLNVVKDTRATIRKLRDMEIEAKMVKDSAASAPYAEKLCQDVATFIPRLGTVIKNVDKLMSVSNLSTLNFEEVARLGNKVIDQKCKYEAMHTWAVKFGLLTGNKRQRTRA